MTFFLPVIAEPPVKMGEVYRHEFHCKIEILTQAQNVIPHYYDLDWESCSRLCYQNDHIGVWVNNTHFMGRSRQSSSLMPGGLY